MAELRPVWKEDDAFLFRVFASTRAHEMTQLDWDEQAMHDFLRLQFNAQHADFTARYPAGDFQIILLDGEPAGRLYVSRSADEILLIDIALLPQFRGKGIGTELLESLLNEARRLAVPLRLHVDKVNPAVTLYKRLGFRLAGEADFRLHMEWRSPQ